MHPKIRKWLAPFSLSNWHRVQISILCAGRLLNYAGFGGGETGDKDMDLKPRSMGLFFNKNSSEITTPTTIRTISSQSTSK